MTRPTIPPHSGTVINPSTFQDARRTLEHAGPTDYVTDSGTPFTAEAHVTQKGNHPGESCILITRDGESRAYVYECCWGYLSNCSGTYLDGYTPKL